MRIEFVPDGSHDCPAVLFYGCPSAGAEALINTFRLLAEAPETEVPLHELADVYPVGDIQLFATMPAAAPAFSNFHLLRFVGGRTEKAGLKPPSLLRRWPAAVPVKERNFSTFSGTAELMLSLRLTGRGKRLLTRPLEPIIDYRI